MVYLVSSDMEALINYVSFVNWLAIGLSVATLLYFRKTRPDAHRPIKVLYIKLFTHNKQTNEFEWFWYMVFPNLCISNIYVKELQGKFLTFLYY